MNEGGAVQFPRTPETGGGRGDAAARPREHSRLFRPRQRARAGTRRLFHSARRRSALGRGPRAHADGRLRGQRAGGRWPRADRNADSRRDLQGASRRQCRAPLPHGARHRVHADEGRDARADARARRALAERHSHEPRSQPHQAEGAGRCAGARSRARTRRFSCAPTG